MLVSKNGASRKIWYYLTNLERILLARRFVKKISLEFHKDRTFLNLIPKLFWSKILEKMNVRAIANCHSVSKELQKIALKLNPRHNRIDRTLDINLFVENSIKISVFDSRISQPKKDVFSASISEVESFWKAANCWNFKEIKLTFISEFSPNRWELFEKSSKNICQFSESLELFMEVKKMKKIVKHFPSNFVRYTHCNEPMEHVWKEFKDTQFVTFGVNAKMPPYKLARNYAHIYPHWSNTLPQEEVIQFCKEFSNEANKKTKLRAFRHFSSSYLSEKSFDGFSVIYKATYNYNLRGLFDHTACIKKTELGIIMIKLQMVTRADVYAVDVYLHRNMKELYLFLIRDLTEFNKLSWNPVDFSEYYQEFFSAKIEELPAIYKKIVEPHPFRSYE